MVREAIGFGDDISAAQEDAREKLGASSEDDVQFEIISQSKKKILGIFGGSKAEVRAYIEIPDPKPVKPRKNAKKTTNEPKKAENKQKAQKPQPEKKEEAPKKEINAVDESEIPADSKTGRAIVYIKKILPYLGCENITIKAAERENGAHIILEGEGLGTIIGHRGETLDSLQYLTSLAANSIGGYFKVTINIGNYRERREQTLSSLAARVSAQVLRNNRSRALEPMNPYERRIIHTAVQDIAGVISSSIGEGSNRRVVIYPEGGQIRPPRRNDNHSRSRKPNNTVSANPAREPKKDTDIPLYGKIN
ncbi:MAG: KH domain-containing protein [Clostridia bacterium]|nr:KH domain-containing protein [Clostridia bacterium]